MLLLRTNCKVNCVLPCVLLLVMMSSPGICRNCFSSGVAMLLAVAVVLLHVIHITLCSLRRQALRVAGILRNVRLGCYFRSWRKRKLTSDNNRLANCHTAFDYREIALLALPRLDGAKIDSVVGLHYKNERPTLANLYGLRRHKRRVRQHVQNKTDPHKLGWPQRAIGIRSHCAGLHGSGAGLHCIIYEVKISRTRCD